jgi:methylamine---corrinoid protein Co-methyltransferase
MGRSFWEVADTLVSRGSKMEIREFDMKIYRSIVELLRKYEIRYEPKAVVQMDDDLLDRVYQAGRDLYLAAGTYCLDTKRFVRFEPAELDEAVRSIRGDMIIGSGSERRTISHRRPEENKPPFIQGGVIGGNATEEGFVSLYQSIAQEPLVDSIHFDPPHVVNGLRVVHNTPLEILAGRVACSKIREALARAGRTGLHLLGGAGSALADITTFLSPQGLTATDAVAAHTTSELKTDLESLNKVGHSIQFGCFRHVWWAPVIGGFAGGPAGAVVAGVAGLFHSLMVGGGNFPSAYFDLQVTPHYKGGATDELSIWITTTAGQAITKHTRAILQGTITTSAGPGTLMMLHEIAASAISLAVSGMHPFGVRIHKPTKPNHGTGLESRWMAEVSRAAVKLDRGKSNEIIDRLIEKYKPSHRNAPEGRTFDELYDKKTFLPIPEYQAVYDQAKNDLERLGLHFDS